VNGAESLVRTLVAGGVTTCFVNPGTSEMYFVQALDRIHEMRSVLCLFENVATGAADGFGRMADRPASTLLHLGPGLANGWSNLHNARRAQSPIINIVGEHATYHLRHDAPLTSDIAAVAAGVSAWQRTIVGPETVGIDTAAAIREARRSPGRIATLIAPADTTWTEGASVGETGAVLEVPRARADAVVGAARLIRERTPAMLLLTGQALRTDGLAAAARIANALPNVEIAAQTSNGRVERGLGRPPIGRIPYPVQPALARLAHLRTIILVGASDPVAFFAYPGKPSRLAPPGSSIHRLSEIDEDPVHALEWLADELGVARSGSSIAAPKPIAAITVGPLTPDSLGPCLAAGIPENAIIVEESVSVGRGFYAALESAPPHDWLQVTGGSIGDGLPLGVGAAVACPGRRVICLEGDGSAMYTNQALWTMARESLDVTVVILNNSGYAILHGELAAIVGGRAGPRASRMFDIDGPSIDWCAMARACGLPATRVDNTAAFATAFASANAVSGPHLIEAIIAR
jgi:acetolactate synthase I/II/III large subunit